VTDLDRAVAFYNTVLGTRLSDIAEADDRRFAMFPAEDGVTGAVVLGEGYVPSTEGALIFLNAGDELEPVVNRVETGGGRVLTPRMEHGRVGCRRLHRGLGSHKVALHAAA
jgi:uncharacterized protein